MNNNLFSIGPLTIHTYGVMVGLGILCAWLLADHRARRAGLSSETLDSLVVCCLVSGYIGAKLLYWVTRAGDIVHDPSILLELTTGFVVYGGILGGFAGTLLYCRRHKQPFLQYADLAMPSIALAQGIGRIGCLEAGCCYGVCTSLPIAVTYTTSTQAPNGVALFPVQALCSVLDLALCLVLLAVARRPHRAGTVLLVYMMGYSAGRFAIEFLRGDSIRGSVGTLSTSQCIALLVLCASVVTAIVRRRRS